MGLLKDLKKENPGRNVVFSAMDTLIYPSEIRQFYGEYVRHLRENGDSKQVRENPESVAIANIKYISGYSDRMTADMWNSVCESESSW